MKNIVHILFLVCFCSPAFAQLREREVISISGGTSASGLISYTIGEAIIDIGTTTTGVTLTQGFEQPNLLEIASSIKFDFKIDTFSTSCNTTIDGKAFITPNNLSGAYKVLWFNNSTNDTVYNLAPGNYYVTVTKYGIDTTILIKKFTVLKGDSDCNLQVLNGMTPNGDNINDFLYIKGIEYYPNNYVAIYNRWGGKEWEGNNYDNTAVVFTGINSKGAEIPSGTYFYNLKYTDHNGQIKNQNDWLELTR